MGWSGWSEDEQEAFLIFAFGEQETSPALPLPAGRWTKILDSAEERWGGAGSAAPAEVESRGEAAVTVAGRSVVLYHTPLE